jgi:hypothetical protein
MTVVGRRIGSLAWVVVAVLSVLALLTAPSSRADEIGYLVNVTVRPGYNFPNADAAVAYGRGICDKIASDRSYPALVGDVKDDFATTDEFQASYLIGQAADELCPEQLWQLRRSAGGYRPGAV